MTRMKTLTLALAVAAVLFTADSASAQRGGRGGYSGGGYSGGGYRGGNYGGYGYNNYGYNNYGYGNHGYNNGYGNNYGNRGYYGSGVGIYVNPGYGYGYNSGYYSQPYANQYYVQPQYSGVVVDTVQQQAPSNISQSMYGGDAQGGLKARVRVMLPAADAQVTIDGTATTITGTDRLFESPALEMGRNYKYTIQATWNQNGQSVTRKQEVDIRPGQESTVVFRNEG